MPLSSLLYRCPVCGRRPVEGSGDEVRCSACGTRFLRAVEGTMILVARPGREEERVPAAELTRAIAAHGGPLEEGEVVEARVLRSRSEGEEPVFFEGRLLGYAERQGAGEEGTLRLAEGALHFTRGGEVADRWRLLDVRALQSSSSRVQISLGGAELVQFRFLDDSPRRWEELLRLALQEAWSDAGRGRIVEYQPRIVAR